MTEERSRRKVSQPVAVVGLLVAACFWGGMYVVAKDAMEVISANWMLCIRFLLASIIMVIVYFKYIKKVDKYAIKGAVITGLFMGAAYSSMTVGLSYINAGNCAFNNGYVCHMDTDSTVYRLENKAGHPYIHSCGIGSHRCCFYDAAGRFAFEVWRFYNTGRFVFMDR